MGARPGFFDRHPVLFAVSVDVFVFGLESRVLHGILGNKKANPASKRVNWLILLNKVDNAQNILDQNVLAPKPKLV